MSFSVDKPNEIKRKEKEVEVRTSATADAENNSIFENQEITDNEDILFTNYDTVTTDDVEEDQSVYSPEAIDEAGKEIFKIAQNISSNKKEWSNEEIVEAIAISIISDVVESNTNMLNSPDSYGWTGSVHNWIIETFGIDVSYEDIQNILNVQNQGIDILKKALNNELTQEDLFQFSKSKLSTDPDFIMIADALDYIPADMVINWAQNGIPENVNIYLRCREGSETTGYPVGFNSSKPCYITNITGIEIYDEEGNTLYEQNNTDYTNSNYTVDETNTVIYNDNLEPYTLTEEEAAKPVDFKTAYKITQGIEYSEEKVVDYLESAQAMSYIAPALKEITSLDKKIQTSETMEELFNAFKDYYGNEETALEQVNIFLNEMIHPREEDFDEDSEISYIEACSEVERLFNLSIADLNIINEFKIVKNGDSFEVVRSYQDGTVEKDPIDSFWNPLNSGVSSLYNKNYFYKKFDNFLLDKTGAHLDDYMKEYQNAYLELLLPGNNVEKLINQYDTGEKNAVNTVASVGTTATVILALALAAETGGTSLALLGTAGAGSASMSLGSSVALASVVGGGTNTLIRSTNALSAGQEYTLGEGIKDTFVGAVHGASIPVSAGIYNYVGTTVKFGSAYLLAKGSSSCALINSIAHSPITPHAIRILAGTAGGYTAGEFSGSLNYGLNYLAYGENPTLEGLRNAINEGGKKGRTVGAIMGFGGAAINEIINYTPNTSVANPQKADYVLSESEYSISDPIDDTAGYLEYTEHLESSNNPLLLESGETSSNLTVSTSSSGDIISNATQMAQPGDFLSAVKELLSRTNPNGPAPLYYYGQPILDPLYDLGIGTDIPADSPLASDSFSVGGSQNSPGFGSNSQNETPFYQQQEVPQPQEVPQTTYAEPTQNPFKFRFETTSDKQLSVPNNPFEQTAQGQIPEAELPQAATQGTSEGFIPQGETPIGPVNPNLDAIAAKTIGQTIGAAAIGINSTETSNTVMETSNAIQPVVFNEEQREKFVAKLTKFGATREEAEKVADFLAKEGVYVDSELQREITQKQINDIIEIAENPEKIYVLAIQPDGELKSYTNSARDMLEISEGKLNPENARTVINFNAIFNNQEGTITIVVPDDNSISGASMIEDTLNSIDGNLESGQKVTLIFSPMVMGEKAQEALTQFASLYEDCVENGTVTPEMDALLKEITDNKEKRYSALISKIEQLIQQDGQVEFKLNGGILAPDYRHTGTYNELNDTDKAIVNAWLSADGISYGYHDCATTIAITGYESNPDAFAGIDPESEAGKALGIGKKLPVKGNAPNNNVVGAQIYAEAVGVNPKRIKNSGVISLDDSYNMKQIGMTTGFLMQWETRDGKDFTGKVNITFENADGTRESKKFKPGETAILAYEKINPDDPEHPTTVYFEVKIPEKEQDKSKRIETTLAQMHEFTSNPVEEGNDYGFLNGISNSDKKMGVQTSVCIVVPNDVIEGTFHIYTQEEYAKFLAEQPAESKLQNLVNSFSDSDSELFSQQLNEFREKVNSYGFDDTKTKFITDLTDKISEGTLSADDAKTILTNIETASVEELENAQNLVFQQKIEEAKQKMIETFKESFEFSDYKINEELKNLDDFFEENDYSEEQILTCLNQSLKNIEVAKTFMDNNPVIGNLYKTGKIDETIFLGLMSFSEEQLNIINPLLSDEKFLKILDPENFFEISSLTVSELEKVCNLIKEDKVVNIQDAIGLLEHDDIYSQLLSQGIDSKTASIMANIEGIKDYDIQEIKELLDNIKATQPSNQRISQILSVYLTSNYNLNLKEFNEYTKSIDFEKLSEMAPAVKDFGPAQYLKFASYYFEDGKKTAFTVDDLTLNEDFTTYLMNNYINADQLTDLMTVFPCTSREVGSLPEGWLQNTPQEKHKETTQAVYSAISSFQQNKDADLFAQEMSNILGKPVTVKKLGNGAFGTGYKISMDGSDDMCLKIFDQVSANGDLSNVHGQHIEVQTGIFVNQHSNKFVKMYFGKVSPNNTSDGFLVTQFLSDGVTPDSSVGIDSGSYTITSDDAAGNHNIINGIIIDFGAVNVYSNKVEQILEDD